MRLSTIAGLFALCNLCLGLKERSFRLVKEETKDLVALFYDSTHDEAADALAVVEQVEGEVDDFVFYKVDITKRANTKLAAEAELEGPATLFVKTIDTGIDQVRVPLQAELVTRYLQLLGLPPVPLYVHSFSSEEALGRAISPSRPTFFMFSERSCAHCLRARRPFQQAAGFFHDTISFVSVDCSASDETSTFCETFDVTTVPSYALQSGEARVAYIGAGRSVAEFEMFFMQNRELLDGSGSGQAARAADHPSGVQSETVSSSTQQDSSPPAAPRRRRADSTDTVEAVVSSTGSVAVEARGVTLSEEAAGKIAALEGSVAKLQKRVDRLESMVKDLLFDRMAARDEE